MASKTSPATWHICRDCLDPLIERLAAIVNGWRRPDSTISPNEIERLLKAVHFDLAITYLEHQPATSIAGKVKSAVTVPLTNLNSMHFGRAALLSREVGEWAVIDQHDPLRTLINATNNWIAARAPDADHDNASIVDAMPVAERKDVRECLRMIDEFYEICNEFQCGIAYLKQTRAILAEKLAKETDRSNGGKYKSGGADSADRIKLFPKGEPDDRGYVEFVQWYQQHHDISPIQNEIARNFATEFKCDTEKALRYLNRMQTDRRRGKVSI